MPILKSGEPLRSASAPLILATPGNPLLSPASGEPLVGRLYPVTETLFSAFNLGYIAIVSAVALACIMALHPRNGAVTLSAEQVGAILPKPPADEPDADSPAGALDGLPRLGLARGAASRLPAPTLAGDARLRPDLDDQRLQHGVPARGAAAARSAAAVPARVSRRRRRGLGHHPAVPVLRGDLRPDAGRAPRPLAGRALRELLDAGHVPARRLRLLRAHEPVRAVGRIEVADRGPVRDGGRARAQGAPRVGRRLLRSRRGGVAQEIEFTFESPSGGDLYMLQTRDMAIRESPKVLTFDFEMPPHDRLLGHGIGVSGGAMSGRFVFTLEEIEAWRVREPTADLILVRTDTVPDDIREINAADGLLTARGGLTSHAAVVAHRLGKTCVVGCGSLECHERQKHCRFPGVELSSGDGISIDGQEGSVYRGMIKVKEA